MQIEGRICSASKQCFSLDALSGGRSCHLPALAAGCYLTAQTALWYSSQQPL